MIYHRHLAHRLKKTAKARRGRLEDAKALFQLWEDHEEEEAWLVEKKRICQTGITAKDLRGLVSLQQKHKALEDELKGRWNKAEKLVEAGRELMAAKHPQSSEIAAYIKSLEQHWKELRVLAEQRKSKLDEAAEAYQFYADANEAESWLREKMPLVRSTDYGEDRPSAQALLARHRVLEEEIRAQDGDIQALNVQADRLTASGVTSLAMGSPAKHGATMENGGGLRGEPDGEWIVDEVRMVPEEYSEEESYERTEYRTVTEERLVPQVKASYAFEGQGMSMAKGEVRGVHFSFFSGSYSGFCGRCPGPVPPQQNQRRLVARAQRIGQGRLCAGQLRQRDRRQAHPGPSPTTFHRQGRAADQKDAHGQEIGARPKAQTGAQSRW